MKRLLLLGTGGIATGEDQDEFVAADARGRIDLADAFLQAFGSDHQHAVAEPVAQRVVDLLEAVEVEEQHRELHARHATARALDGGLQQLV